MHYGKSALMLLLNQRHRIHYKLDGLLIHAHAFWALHFTAHYVSPYGSGDSLYNERTCLYIWMTYWSSHLPSMIT